jgi:hypothetical protein
MNRTIDDLTEVRKEKSVCSTNNNSIAIAIYLGLRAIAYAIKEKS